MSSAELNSLGIAKPVAETRVVVAMSGGVDSSVVAAMLKDEGYDVIGVTLQLYDHGAAIEKKGACCAGQDIYDARRVASDKNFPHYVLDYESRFREDVIDDFADAYLRGETPIPCVRCNQTVKFRDLMATAQELNADVLATGHYIQRHEGENGPELHRAHDGGKDQSYFLFATTHEQLAMLRFPLGSYPKSQTRELAAKYGLSVADKPDSQDICFVPDGDYAKLVSKLRPEAAKPGDIVSSAGEKLGKHDGIINYTIGQRKGLGIGGLVEPLYVTRLNATANQVIVGPKAELARHLVHISEMNWIGEALAIGESLAVSAKVRSVSDPEPATVKLLEGNRAELLFDLPQYGVAPGQAAVVYQGDRVLGGGWIVGAETVAR